jgi:hypothetical protein
MRPEKETRGMKARTFINWETVSQNQRPASVKLSLSQTSKNTILLLMSSLQQNWRKGRTGSAWKGGGEERGRCRRTRGVQGRNGPMYAHMNK